MFFYTDTALAFAANAYGMKCYTIETSLNYHQKALLGDKLIAETTELSRDLKRAVYEVKVYRDEHDVISTFRGIVHVSNKKWEI